MAPIGAICVRAPWDRAAARPGVLGEHRIIASVEAAAVQLAILNVTAE